MHTNKFKYCVFDHERGYEVRCQLPLLTSSCANRNWDPDGDVGDVEGGNAAAEEEKVSNNENEWGCE